MLIFTAIPKIAAEVGAIGKDRSNKVQGYSFRGIEDMYNAVQPALIKHGVFCAPQVVDRETRDHTNDKGTVMHRVHLRVCHKFIATDGSFVDVVTEGEGLDSSDKATNKAMSAAMKYAFIELLSIPTLDIADSDRDHPVVSAFDSFRETAVLPSAINVQKKTAPPEVKQSTSPIQPVTPISKNELLVSEIRQLIPFLSEAHQTMARERLEKIKDSQFDLVKLKDQITTITKGAK